MYKISNNTYFDNHRFCSEYDFEFNETVDYIFDNINATTTYCIEANCNNKTGELDLLQYFPVTNETIEDSVEEVIEAIEENFISRRYSIRFI